MKVAFLIPKLIYCGPINVILGIIDNIKMLDDGVDFTIICVHSHVDNLLLDKLRDENLSSVCFLSDFNTREKFIDSLSNFDVIHSHGFHPDRLLSKLNVNSKKISTSHCMFFKDYPKEYGFLKGMLSAFLHFLYYKYGNFNYIVGCSKSVSNYIFFKIQKKSIISINNGVNQSIFKPIEITVKQERKKELGLGSYERIFIFSGRLIRRKRVPELIKYFIQNANPSDFLIILGDGDELDICIDETKGYINILFMGHVENPEYYYQISDFVISNSSAEGYPMSILEAVSCGCFALLSNIEPHLEFFESHPNISKLLNDFNFNDNTICNNHCSLSKLSSLVMAKNYLDIYKE